MPVDVYFLSQTQLEIFESQRQIQNTLMVSKSLNGLVPEYLTSKFIKRNESNYILRGTR